MTPLPSRPSPLPGRRTITLRINGRQVTRDVDPRLLLSDFLQHELGLTGTHVGCEQGVCGACTVLLNDQPVRSCLLFAVQADGQPITTVEGLSADDRPHPVQEAFRSHHALQCGFCTPGFLTSLAGFMKEGGLPEDEEAFPLSPLITWKRRRLSTLSG